jgi:hypothetical protein
MILSVASVHMTATEREWVYLVEPVEHLLVKDVDVAMKDVERQGAATLEGAATQDVVRRALVEDLEALHDATALDADTWLQQGLELDAEALHLDAEALHLDAEVQEM